MSRSFFRTKSCSIKISLRLVKTLTSKILSSSQDEKYFFIIKLLKLILASASTILIQLLSVAYLGQSATASYQICIKLLGLTQLFFVSGFGDLSLSRSKENIISYLDQGAYMLFLLPRVIIYCILIIVISKSRLNIPPEIWPLNLNLLLAISLILGLATEASKFMYSERLHNTYELNSLKSFAVALALVLFSIIAFSKIQEPNSQYSKIFPFVLGSVYCLARLIPELKYLFHKAISLYQGLRFNISLIIHDSGASGALKKYLVTTTKASLLAIVAYINWASDILLIGLIGSDKQVNTAVFLASFFTLTGSVVHFYLPRLQLMYSEKLSNTLSDIYGIPIVSIVPVVLLNFLTMAAGKFVFEIASLPIEPPSLSLYPIMGVSFALMQIGEIQGQLISSSACYGRQILKDLVVIIPLNIMASLYFYRVMGISGVYLATILSISLSIVINSFMIKSVRSNLSPLG